MAEPQRLSDMELEGALRDLGARYPYPPTPNLAAAVRRRIVAPAAPVRRVALWRDPRRLALAAAVVLVLAGAAALINPTTRDAIAHFFHVRGVIVTRVTSPPPSLSPATPLELGRRTTMADAQAAVSFTIAVPTALGAPDAVYLNSGVPGGEVALAYAPRPGIPLVKQTGLGVLITEFRGDLLPGFLTKEVGPSTKLEETSVNGDPGWWVSGEPHWVFVRVSGTDYQETLRMAANTLIWEHRGVTYRIESNLSKAEAFRIAAGLP
jgi:hypothetical protein